MEGENDRHSRVVAVAAVRASEAIGGVRLVRALHQPTVGVFYDVRVAPHIQPASGERKDTSCRLPENTCIRVKAAVAVPFPCD